MNKTNFVEVRPNIWINKDDPLYEQKFKHYSTKFKNVGHPVTDDSPEDIKRATQRAQTATAAKRIPPTQPQPLRRRRFQQKPKFSFFDWFTGWVQAGFLLGCIIGTIFVLFYIFVISLQ